MPWTRTINIEKELDKSISKEIRSTAFIILRGVISRTPVDTERLKLAWTAGVNRIPTDESGNNEIYLVNKYTDIVYIINNVDYAQYIEDGHGGRAPGVMIKATLAGLK